MTVIFPLLLLVIFFAVVAFTFSEGLWSNAIRLVNVVTAGLLAINFWEPVARMVEGWGEFFASITYFLDFLCFWLLFALFMVIFRVVTGTLSKTKVKFLKVIDQLGGLGLSMIVAWIMVCITGFTMHMAPLAKAPFQEGFDPAKGPMMWGISPDGQWGFFTALTSVGSFSRTMSEEDYSKGAYGQQISAESQYTSHKALFGRLLPYPEKGPIKFTERYYLRRAELEELSKSGSARPAAGKVPKR